MKRVRNYRSSRFEQRANVIGGGPRDVPENKLRNNSRQRNVRCHFRQSAETRPYTEHKHRSRNAEMNY